MRQATVIGIHPRGALVLLGACLLAVACGSAPPTAGDAAGHRVERTTDGDVTTVRNLGGSKWGGNATLAVELEIGVDEGDDRYMLVTPYPFFATEDEIFAVEAADSRVRIYGFDGVHRRDFGVQGPGPGELGRIFGIFVTPEERVLISHFSDGGAFKVSVFTVAGEHIEDWNVTTMGVGRVSLRPGPNAIAYTPDGLVGTIRERPEEPSSMVTDFRQGFQRIGKEGLLGEPWMVPASDLDPPTVTIDMDRFSYEQPVPFAAARAVSAVAPDGSRIWGFPDRYAFQIEHPDGRTTVVERVTDPVPVHPDEADHRRRQIVQSISQRSPDFTWDGSGIPDTKPWYRMFIPDHRGRVWVSREGPATPVQDCTEPEDPRPGEPSVPCWEAQPILDVFALDGNFLGSLDRPEGLQLFGPFIRGDVMVAGHQDEMGVWKIRVYRIVLPGTEEEPT